MKGAFIILLICCLWSCNQDPRSALSSTGSFGAPLENVAPIEVTQVLKKLETENQVEVITTGTVVDFCKGEGCWLMLENKGGDPFLVEIKNNAFVLPYRIDGKTAVVQGVALMDSTESGSPAPKMIASGIEIK